MNERSTSLQQLRRHKRKRHENDTYQMMKQILVSIICWIATEIKYLLFLPPPIIPHLRFNIDYCDTMRTDGLRAEHVFRFTLQCCTIKATGRCITDSRGNAQRRARSFLTSRDCVSCQAVCPILCAISIWYVRCQGFFAKCCLFWFHTRWQYLTTLDTTRLKPCLARWSAEVTELVSHTTYVNQ